jgi:hypothetical protein
MDRKARVGGALDHTVCPDVPYLWKSVGTGKRSCATVKKCPGSKGRVVVTDDGATDMRSDSVVFDIFGWAK